MLNARLRTGLVGVALMLATACATGSAANAGKKAAERGDWDAAVAYYREALGQDPGKLENRIALERAMRAAADQHVARARALEAQDQLAGAAAEYRLAADLEPSNSLALTKAIELERRLRMQMEATRPPTRMEEMQREAAQTSPIPRLDPRTRVPGLRFPNAVVRDILTAISTATGINITYDQGLEGTLARGYSIDVTDVPLENVLNQVLSANGMTFKVLDSKTIFVYADNATNRGKYEDQYQQTFYLSHADVQEIVQIINQLLTSGPAVRPVITQNKSLNAIVVRATAPVMGVVENIIRANDKPRAEVLIDVEILEVSRSRMKDLGIDLSTYGVGLTFSPESVPQNGPPAAPPPINFNSFRNISSGNFYATVPSMVIRLLESDQKTRLLAKPQLRGREGATLTLNLGEDYPVPQTSFLPVATGGVPTQPQIAYSYRPIGVNLQITPRVTFQDEIILDPIVVDKSGVGPNVDVSGQSLPTFIKRTAQVAMRLRDGESNLLAGLIKEEDFETMTGFAGVNSIPILRDIFGHKQATGDQSDIIMIVTPHIIRSREIQPEDLRPMYIGTGQNFGAGGTPQLISPTAPPPPAVLQSGQAGPPTQAGQQVAPPTGAVATPPAATTPPARAAGAVPIEPVTGAVPTPPAAGAQIVLTVPSAEFQLNGPPYTVPVSISGVSQLGAVTLTITYDPTVLRAASVSQGTFMQQGGVTPTFVPKIDAAAGRVDVVLSRATDEPGAAGTGLLAGLVFQAVGAGQSRISVTAVAMTPSGQAIPLQTTPVTVTVK